MHYEVRFGRKQNNILSTSIVFGVINEEFEGEEYSLTNKFEVFRIMATMVKIIKKYMELHPKIYSYEFTGEPSKEKQNRSGKVKLALYNRYLSQIFDKSWKFTFNSDKTIVSKKNSLA